MWCGCVVSIHIRRYTSNYVNICTFYAITYTHMEGEPTYALKFQCARLIFKLLLINIGIRTCMYVAPFVLVCANILSSTHTLTHTPTHSHDIHLLVSSTHSHLPTHLQHPLTAAHSPPAHTHTPHSRPLTSSLFSTDRVAWFCSTIALRFPNRSSLTPSSSNTYSLLHRSRRSRLNLSNRIFAL